MTATWCNLSQDDRVSPESVYAVSEDGILDGYTDIDPRSLAEVDEALVGSDGYIKSRYNVQSKDQNLLK